MTTSRSIPLVFQNGELVVTPDCGMGICGKSGVPDIVKVMVRAKFRGGDEIIRTGGIGELDLVWRTYREHQLRRPTTRERLWWRHPDTQRRMIGYNLAAKEVCAVIAALAFIPSGWVIVRNITPWGWGLTFVGAGLIALEVIGFLRNSKGKRF